jgi:AraC-like DNA-binding protein
VFVEQVKTDATLVGWFVHDDHDEKRATEWWSAPTIAFSFFGSWRLRCAGGGGEVSPAAVMVASGSAEYECVHDDLEDRMLSVSFLSETDLGRLPLLPHNGELRVLGRALVRELRSPERDDTEIDILCESLGRAVRDGPEGRRSEPAASTRRAVEEVRLLAERHYLRPELDLVAEAAATGLSRTRFTHSFRDLVGVSPHRFLLGLRLAHAARLLRRSDASIAEVCFASGFGTLQSFNAAFRLAFGMPPGVYRTRATARRRPAQFL